MQHNPKQYNATRNNNRGHDTREKATERNKIQRKPNTAQHKTTQRDTEHNTNNPTTDDESAF